MKKCGAFALIILLECVVLIALYTNGIATIDKRQGELLEKRRLVHQLYLTDLSIWTEARYTRHPAMADRFAAFQDVPASIEHFPAGSIVPPSNAGSGHVNSDGE